MKSIFHVGVIALATFMCGCTDAQYSQMSAYGSKFRVTLYSGGVPVKTWTSTGKVLSEEKSDGYFFTDEKTNKLIRASGTLSIEQL